MITHRFHHRINLEVLLFIFTLASISNSYAWNPRSNWKDSYAVDGQCYCDSSNYDHELDTKTARTPLGIKNVVTICNDLHSVLGDGPTNGRVPYNDIQCGHGSANNAVDETGCPGRVDQGNNGCEVIGPRWNLELVYGPRPESCTASRALLANQWYMFSLPCDVEITGKASVAEVLADDLGSEGIGTIWTIFELMPNGSYQELSLTDKLAVGNGYWLISSEAGRNIDVVGEFAGEVDTPLNSDTSIGAWTMIGSPFHESVAWADIRVVDMDRGIVQSLSDVAPSNDPCISTPLSSECVLANIAFKWTEAEVYEQLDLTSGSFDRFDAAWVFAARESYRARVPNLERNF